jgi:hypothetical protein
VHACTQSTSAYSPSFMVITIIIVVVVIIVIVIIHHHYCDYYYYYYYYYCCITQTRFSQLQRITAAFSIGPLTHYSIETRLFVEHSIRRSPRHTQKPFPSPPPPPASASSVDTPNLVVFGIEVEGACEGGHASAERVRVSEVTAGEACVRFSTVRGNCEVISAAKGRSTTCTA